MRLSDLARRLSGATGLAAGLALLGNTAAAQSVTPDTRWQTWLGCWEAVQPDSAPSVDAIKKPRICVIPAAGQSAVDVATIVGDSVALRQHIEATGEQRQLSKDGCTGWERATWSANGQRVYLRSAYTCPGGLTRSSNGVMAMSSDGEWLDVLGVVAGTTVGVRTARYRPSYQLDNLPSEIALALKDRAQWSNDARIAASARLTTGDVVDASKYLDPGVIQTWLAERGEGFALDATQLAELEKAGVAPLVIDVMVALSYPQVFALDRTRVGGPPADSMRAAEPGRTVYVYGWDPFYSPYGYRSRYGYPSYYGYPYGYGYGSGWYNGSRPVVIVRQPSSGERAAHGRVDRDRGYTPGSGAIPRRGSASGTGHGGAASSGSSGSSSRGVSSGSGASSRSPSSGSGRTAKARPPR